MTRIRRTLGDWLDYQQRLHPRSVDLGLDRVRKVAERLALLPVAGRTFIVGGTNGKGSTATYLAALLGATGERVGLFTSPHLIVYNERIRIGGLEVADQQLIEAFERIEAARAAESLTFFEFNTLAALELFRAGRVGATVLEVGLGGRLDATNLVDADVAVLCSVSMDHTDWLGDTLEAIGHEKSGIFRVNKPVVLGCSVMPLSVFEAAEKMQCDLRIAGEDFTWTIQSDGRWTFRDAAGSLDQLAAPAALGAVQYRNAATALAAIRAAPRAPALTSRQVSDAMVGAHIPGRLQVMSGPVEWLLDVSHNEAAAGVLASELQQRPVTGRTLAVFGMLADKDARAVAKHLDPLVDEWLLCTLNEPRGLKARTLQARVGSLRGTVRCCSDVVAACEEARRAARVGDRILVFGSFHTVGPALQWLQL